MKKIFGVFKHDIKKIFRSIIAFIVIIGLSVLPALYAWFNIASNWNPYDNSGNIPVAVVNLDKGCTVGFLKLSFGDDIVDNLKKNTQMGWSFVDKETADQGIIDGDYYAAVIISEDFSENLVSITSGELKSPEITYVVNEKKNAIAPKITDKGIQAIETEVNSSFVEEITDIAATLLNTSSDTLSESKDEICDKIISALDESESSLSSLKSTVTVVSDSMDSVSSMIETNKAALPELDEKLEDADEFISSIKDTIKALESASSGISSSLDSSFDTLDSLAASMDAELSDIKAKINSGESDIADEIESLTGICNKIIEIDNAVIDILSGLEDTSGNGISSIITTVEDSMESIASLTGSLSDKLDAAFEAIEKDSSTAADRLAQLEKINQSIISVNNTLIPALNNLSEKLGIDTTAAVEKLNALNTKQNTIISKIDSAVETLKKTGTLPKNLKSDLDAIIKEAESTASQLKTEVNSILSEASKSINSSDAVEFLNSMSDTQSKIISKLNTAAEALKSSDSSLPDNFTQDIETLISSAESSVSRFESYYLTPVKNALKSVIDKSETALDELSSTLSSSTVTEDIEDALDSAQKIIGSVGTAFDDVEKLIDKGIEGISDIKEKVQNLKGNSSIENFISTIVDDPEALGEFISSPVKINTEEVFPVSDYGSAMAPFYTVLALWVGGIVLVAVLKTNLSKSDIKTIGEVKPYQEYFGRYLIFLVISLLQATIVALGDVFFLGIQCENLFLFLVTSWITIIVFSLLIYSLTVSFSVIGKAVAVIILIVQVAGSGGTFPPELLPDFFQNLIRFMPFNYAINAMRETVAGVTYSSYWENILYLLCFIPVALIIGILFRKPCMRAMRFFNKRLDETDLIL